MATIVFGSQLQPTSLRPATARRLAQQSSTRSSTRPAAHTQELRRVYRRRRMGVMLAVATVAIAAMVSVFSLFGASAAADGSAGRSLAPKYIVAQPGDTLWSIGERIAPNSAISDVVNELVRLNGTSLTSGQLVRIP